MRPELKAQRKIEKLEALGVELTDEERETIYESFRQEKRAKVNAASEVHREAEAVLKLIAYQGYFIHRECRWCHGLFATDYSKVSYCSVPCRIAALDAVGITWNPLKDPAERWGYNGDVWHDDNGKLHNVPMPAPLIISATTLELIANHPEVQKFIQRSMLEIKLEDQEEVDPELAAIPLGPRPAPEPVKPPQIAPEDALDALLA